MVDFGGPIDFGDLLSAPPTGKTYKAIAEKTLEVIGKLGQEEKTIRAELTSEREDVPQPERC